MGPDNRQKICPACKSLQPIQATSCQCGHQFRTQFTPLDQTQVINPQPQSQSQPTASYPAGGLGNAAYPAQLPYQLVTGPKDLFEWRLSGFWAWALVAVGSNVAYWMVRFSEFTEMWYWILAVWGMVLSFAVLRLRRFYAYPPAGVMPRFWNSCLAVMFIVGGYITYKEVKYAAIRADILQDARILFNFDFIGVGMTRDEVIAKLGGPDSKTNRTIGEGDSEKWTYDIDGVARHVVFLNGRVVNVYSDDRN